MFEVPGPIRTLFDTFPLKTYPPVYSKPDEEGLVYFETKDPASLQSSAKFTLGVHGLIQIEGKMIPTDPFSLANCLILCYRHGLLLPKSDKKSSYSMMALSYEASPTDELPILVEQNEENVSIITSDEICTSLNKKYFNDSVTDLLINSFLDDLNDLWVLILLSDVAQSQGTHFEKIFDFIGKNSGNEFVKGLLVTRLLHAIPSWCSFKAKNPLLFTTNRAYAALRNKELTEVFYKSNAKALQKLYFEKMCLFERNLLQVWDFVRTRDNSEVSAILELKIAAFIFIISEFVSDDTHIGLMIKRDDFKDIVKECRSIVLDRFS